MGVIDSSDYGFEGFKQQVHRRVTRLVVMRIYFVGSEGYGRLLGVMWPRKAMGGSRMHRVLMMGGNNW